MKTNWLIYIGLFIFNKIIGVVDFGPISVVSNVWSNQCERFVRIDFTVNWQVNNKSFRVWRSVSPSFNTAALVGTVSGCGTCNSKTYTIFDNYVFTPGYTYYYRIESVSNWDVSHYKYAGSVYIPQSIDFTNQVADYVNIGSSPNTEQSYQWHFNSNKKQGVVISLYPTEIYNIYVEQNNFELVFKTTEFTKFVQIKASINSGNFFNIYNGQPVVAFDWISAQNYFSNFGQYSMKVKFLTWDGKWYDREYRIFVVQQSDELHVDNYCNTIRVWRGSAGPGGFDGIPIILSEGYDPYNMKAQQYYRYAGKDLIDCLLKKGFNVYIVNYSFNSQSIINNAAVFSSAIRYVYSLNNKKVVAAGISMGGIINRLACALAEQNNNPLPISKFVTIDSPHQGAIVSKELQDWRKQNTTGDLFAEHASNNPAALSMLTYNPYDQGASHTVFYNYLKSINGDGYPHQVEKIGITFSNSSPNPNSVGTKWLELTIKNNANSSVYKSFKLSSDEVQAGSYLPKLNIDPMYIYLISTNKWYLSPLQPLLDPYLTFSQYADPTFIPHNSALDISNGVSPFDKIIIPSSTYFHDQIPSELMDQILNALITNTVYIQGKVYLNTTKNIIASSQIIMGEYVTPTLNQGMVRIINSNIKLKAGEEISILDEVWIEEGSDFSAIILFPVTQCDNEYEQQVMRTNTSKNPDSLSYFSVSIENNRENNNRIKNGTDIILFPNPTSDHFHISMAEEDFNNLRKIELVNTLGQVKELPVSITQNISDLPEGLYMIKFYFSRGELVVKSLIIKKK